MRLKTTIRADGIEIYTTVEGDMVDAIAFTAYGGHANNTQILYEANEGLARRGPVLPAGVEIVIPAKPPAREPRHTIRLWD